jgi:hypothetical protein
MPSSATPDGYFQAKDACAPLTADKRSLFDLFGDKQKGFITVELTGSRSLVTLVPEAIARKLLKSKNLLRAAAPAPQPAAAPVRPAAGPAAAAAAAPQADQAKPRLKPEPMTAQQRERAIEGHSGEVFSRWLFTSICTTLAAAEEPPLVILQLRAGDDLVGCSVEATELIRLRFPDLPAEMSHSNWGPAVRAFVATLDGRDLAELLAVIPMAEELSNEDRLDALDDYSTITTPLATALRIDMKALQAKADEKAAEIVEQQEDARMGRTTAGDAFAAAHGTEASDAAA